jgi:hypothetical protein
MAEKSDNYVRFYFGVSISYLMPPNPYGKHDHAPEEKWARRCFKRLQADIAAKISKEGFEVAYRKHTTIDDALRLYAADFVVSALHPFPAAQLFTPRKGFSGFRVRTKPFSKVKTIFARKIADSLKTDYVVNAIAYEYAASRNFVYEVYLGGTLKIEHVISPNDISDSEGSVRTAIEYFNGEVADFLQTHGWDAFPETTARRPKDGVYEFELYQGIFLGFPENEVFGTILMEKDMPLSEASILGIDCDDDSLAEAVSAAEASLRDLIEIESQYSVTELSVGFVDYDEELYDNRAKGQSKRPWRRKGYLGVCSIRIWEPAAL